VLSEGQAAARGGDGAAEFFGGFEAFLDDGLDVGESFLSETRNWKFENEKAERARRIVPFVDKADPSAPVGMTSGRRAKRGQTEVRPYI